ncbi:MAG: winged helix-turn-helix domain-containing protein [bacterium]
MKILENKYRGSLICRAVSYPIAYAIVKMLLDEGPMNLDDIVGRVNRTKPNVCQHLAKLKLANMVRYEKEHRKTRYWIKYPEEVRSFFACCEKLVERTTKRIKQDY